ncbi:MAG: hypothetical protein CMR00_08315 [[Chlorobium] sp. 445]|nr:MAG: hypothetical protein CMR00_08315 [[Chlorobium] sp. 445]
MSERVVYQLFGIVLLIVAGAMAASAQVQSDIPSPFSLNSPTFLAPSLWREGENAAGLCATALPKQSRTGMILWQDGGRFRRPQAPLSSTTLHFFSEGAQRFGEWTTRGSFHYERRTENDVRWSNVHNAYAGTPFIWADSVGGNWQKDLVLLSAALGTPEFLGFLSAGILADYDVAQGARQNDTRPLFRSRNIRLVPSVAFHLSKALRIGLTATYLSRFEEGEFGAADISFPQLIYLRGLGTANTTVLNAAERRTVGEGFGIGAQAQVRLAEWQVSLAGNFLLRQDSTQDLAFVPELRRTAFRFAGRYDERRLSATLAARYTQLDFGVEGALHAQSLEGRGTDPIFLAVNTIDQTQAIALLLDWWQGASRLYAPLTVGIHTSLSDLLRRDILAETKWQRTLLAAHLVLGSAQRLGEQLWLMARVSGGIAIVPASSYTANRMLELTPILVRPDFLVNAASRFWLGAQLALETPVAALNNSTVRLVLQGSTLQSPAQLDDGSRLGGRNEVNAGVELVF